MASTAFDTLQYLRRLIETGVPRAQAEVMATAHGEHTESLVTQGFLSAKLEASDARTNAHFDIMSARMEALEERIGVRIEALEERMGVRIGALEDRMDGRFESMQERMSSQFRFITFTQAIVAGGVLIPLLNSWIL